ncbi:hypothetical protein DPEC_G00301730 [Dallia pectoralis]|uniref:Uncharacterized protein n=1 Tax=Dallia pectoralis TaxID=75939 RepID=A0ACC2FGW5_DALPE|nr:hypothetical protein DPEC_G00301730 [Dallia pectoralis]
MKPRGENEKGENRGPSAGLSNKSRPRQTAALSRVQTDDLERSVGRQGRGLQGASSGHEVASSSCQLQASRYTLGQNLRGLDRGTPKTGLDRNNSWGIQTEVSDCTAARAQTNMAPSAQPSKDGIGMDEDDYCGINTGDRKARKPLVEKKRRARINESLQELRTLLADTDLQLKMENAEVLEMTVKKVEHILKSRTQETDTMNREASERFAAGYIQCMHEVHMFVSNCPGIDATVAAELLNHLLECMPLNEDHFQDMLLDFMSDTSSSSNNGGSTWLTDETLCAALASPGGRSISSGSSSALFPAPCSTSGDDLSSDLDETDSEHSHTSTDALENRDAQNLPTIAHSKSIWRPW